MAADSIDELLDRIDLDVDLADVDLDREQIAQIKWIGRLVRRQGEQTMADLTNLQATLDKLVTDEQTAAADVAKAFADLQASIDALSAGQITQAQIDALAAQAQTVDDSLTALDASAKSADIPPTA
jgi:predicted XRE-type DNA-binding protein